MTQMIQTMQLLLQNNMLFFYGFFHSIIPRFRIATIFCAHFSIV